MLNNFDIGIKNIVEGDRDSQIEFLSVLAEDRYIDIEYLLSRGCFFVPNQDYIFNMFGPSSLNYGNDLYEGDGTCKWLGHLVIPIRGAMGELVGFAGFNPLSKKISRDNLIFGTDNEVPPKYIYSNKSCFDRGRYLYVPNGYRKLISSKVAILTDGIFDSITPGSLGYSTVCNLGSIVNDYTLYILSFVPRLYVAYDNDEAGISLYEYLKKKLPNVQSITQSKTKDLDDYIRKYGTSKFIEEIDKAGRNRIFSSILL